MEESSSSEDYQVEDEEEEEEDGNDDDHNDDSSDDGGTFLQQFAHRPSRPTKALQRASIAAKTRRNPGLSLADRVGKRGLQAIQAPAVKKKKAKVPPKPKYEDPEDLTSPEMPKKSKPVFSPDDYSDTGSPTRSKYFRSSKMAVKWNAYEALGGSDEDMDNDGGNTPTATKANNYNSRMRQPPTKHVAEDSSDDDGDDEEAYIEIEDKDDDELTPIVSRKRQPQTNPAADSSDEEFRMESSRTSSRKPTASALIDSPEPVPTKSKRNYQRNTIKRPKYSLSDSEDDDEEELQPAPKLKKINKKKATKTTKPAARSRTSHASDEEEHVITNEESMDEAEMSDIQKAITASKKDQKGSNDEDDAILLDDSDMDEDEAVALRHALKASKKDAAAKSNSTTNSDDEKPVEELLEDSSDDDEEEDRGDSYEEEKKEASSVLHTAEQLSAQVIQHMTGWTKEKDSSSAAHKGMIVDGALSLGFMQGSDTDPGNTANHKWISQEEMQQACPDVKLSNYQLIGVNWLALLHSMKCTIEGKSNTNVNGVLADEMGLGKTVQTIAFLAWLKYKRKSRTTDIDSDDGASVIEEASWPHIIVVPVSVLPNWEREFETFCPQMNVVKYHGSLTDREEIQDKLREYLPQTRSKNPPLDVILAPITYFQKEKSDDRKFLNKFRFDYLVVDEAHMLKNSESLRYKMLDRVSTRHRLLLTGTPVQNSPQELLNMLCFLMPLFSRGKGSVEGDDNVGDRMLQYFVDEQRQNSGDEETAYKKLKRLFAPFVLRRKKIDVIAQLLPPKERIVEVVELDTEGRKVYNDILADHVNKNGAKLSAAIGENLFTNLRKAAHHPLLLRTRHKSRSEIEHLTTCFHKYGAFKGEGSTKARVHEEITKFNDFHIHLTALDLIEENHHRRGDLDRYVLNEDALFSSAKFVKLKSLLPKLISEGHRILIFSVWTSCLDLLGCLMEHLELDYLRMDGSCSSADRQELIDRFNQDNSIPIFLLSTKACGLGINLTAADTCIIHDLDFNPFNDLQAEDRCHRIGQKKPVTVYKLVTNDTVDSQIYDMQERKAKMNAAIMESNTNNKDRKEILQDTVKRFLGSSSKAKKGSTVSNKENEKEVVCLL